MEAFIQTHHYYNTEYIDPFLGGSLPLTLAVAMSCYTS